MISNLLSKLDMFGRVPQFSINSNDTYKTPLGGLLTINCGILLVIFMIFFGDDFYNKKNPKVIESKMFNEDYYTRNITTNQGIIAWKIEDHYTVMPNFTGVLYPKIIYSSFVLNQTTNNLDFMYEKILPNKKCADVADLDPLFSDGNDVNNWYCMDFTGINFPFGGYWGGKIVNMIYLVLDSCNADKTQCSSLEDIKKLAPGAKNNLFFSMLYPQHYFSPQNITNPLNYEYYYFTETIDLNVIKKNVFFFKDVQCDDDLGWIFPDVKKYKIFAFDSFFKDYFYKPEDEYKNVKSDMNTFIYMNSIYFNKNPYYYKRSFMKLQDLAAIVGGILKSVILGFSIFAQVYNTANMKKYMIDNFFLRVTKDKNEDLTHLRYTNTDYFSNNCIQKSEAELIPREIDRHNNLEHLNNYIGPNNNNHLGNKNNKNNNNNEVSRTPKNNNNYNSNQKPLTAKANNNKDGSTSYDKITESYDVGNINNNTNNNHSVNDIYKNNFNNNNSINNKEKITLRNSKIIIF